MTKKIIAFLTVLTFGILPLTAQIYKSSREYQEILGGDAEKSKETPKYSYLYDTSLIRAIKTKDTDRIKLLIYANIDANEKNDEGFTPLYAAAETNLQLEYITMMLQRNAKVNLPSTGNVTPLMKAVELGRAGIVKLFLEYGADPSLKDDTGATALIYAAKNKQAAMVPLLAAARNLNPDERDNTKLNAVLYAFKNKDIPTLRALVKAGANINTKDDFGRTPLINAVNDNDMFMTKELLALKANKEEKDNTGRTALLNAVQAANEPMAKYLVDEGADVEATDLVGYTPVILASKEGNVNLVKLLVAAGANFNASDKLARTPLVWSLTNKDSNLFYTLLSFPGLKINTPYGPTQMTPLMMAAENKDTKAVASLINLGADIEAKDTAGETVLFYSVRLNDLETATLLINYYPEIYFKNAAGEDMIDVAKNARFTRMAILLATAPLDIAIPQINLATHTRVYDIEGYIASLESLLGDAKEVKQKRDMLKAEGILK